MKFRDRLGALFALLLAALPGAEAGAADAYPHLWVRRDAWECIIFNKGARKFGWVSYHGNLRTMDSCWQGARAFADVNGDGHLDDINTLGVFLGHGDGQFGVITTAFRPRNSAMSVAAGDLNGDGYADVILGTLGLHLFLGRPDGTLRRVGSLGIRYQAGGVPPLLKLVDLDGDGDLDLLGGGAAGPLVAFNLGDLRFEAPERKRRVRYPHRMTICDLNRDGIPDLLSTGSIPLRNETNWQIAVFLYMGVGEHRIGDEVVLDIPGLTSRYDDREWQGVAAGDWDRDGDDDILAGAGPGKLAFYAGHGDGTFEEPSIVPLPILSDTTALLLHDLDLDGYLDLVAGYADAESKVYWGKEEGYVDFGQPTDLAVSWPGHIEVLTGLAPAFVRGDADRDGVVVVTDAVVILEQIFAGREVPCGDASDADDSGRVAVTDAIFLLNHLFFAGPAPPYPYPEPGGDVTVDYTPHAPRSIHADLGCAPETFDFWRFHPCFPKTNQADCRNPIRQFLDLTVR